MKNGPVVSRSFDRFAGVALVGLLVLAAFLLPGCRHREAEHAVLECRFELVEPYLGELAPELVRSAQVGNPAPLRRALLGLGLTVEKVETLFSAWHACLPRAASRESHPPSPDAGVP